MGDALRFAVGTLTRIPVQAPSPRVNLGWGMALAPVIGFVLAIATGALAVGLSTVLVPLVTAVLATGFLVWITRAIHLDGLADSTDALGSGRPREQALEIARRSDIGPFGVIAVVLTLLAVVAAIASLIEAGNVIIGLTVSLTTGRLVTTLSCSRGIPAARPDGLGAFVAGTVKGTQASFSIVFTILVAGFSTLIAPSGLWAFATLGGLCAGLLFTRFAVRRLGGITGDTLGAATEIATVVALVICTITVL